MPSKRVVAANGLLIGVGVLASAFLLGVARSPWGSAPSAVLAATHCPQDGEDVLVEGPGDRPADEAELYPPGRDWSLLGYELEDELGVTYTWSAERKLKASLPWAVRFGVEWDSEGGLLATYGDREQICMIARVVEWQLASSSASRGRPSPHHHSGQGKGAASGA